MVNKYRLDHYWINGSELCGVILAQDSESACRKVVKYLEEQEHVRLEPDESVRIKGYLKLCDYKEDVFLYVTD